MSADKTNICGIKNNTITFYNEFTNKISIDCVMENDNLSIPIERKVHFSVLGRPVINDAYSQTGEVTAIISRSGNIYETEYKIYYSIDSEWKTVTYKRLGIPYKITEIIDELVWYAPNIKTDNNCFDEHLKKELTNRLKYFYNHVKLAERYITASNLVRFENI